MPHRVLAYLRRPARIIVTCSCALVMKDKRLLLYQVCNAVQSLRNSSRLSNDGITNLTRRMLEVSILLLSIDQCLGVLQLQLHELLHFCMSVILHSNYFFTLIAADLGLSC